MHAATTEVLATSTSASSTSFYCSLQSLRSEGAKRLCSIKAICPCIQRLVSAYAIPVGYRNISHCIHGTVPLKEEKIQVEKIRASAVRSDKRLCSPKRQIVPSIQRLVSAYTKLVQKRNTSHCVQRQISPTDLHSDADSSVRIKASLVAKRTIRTKRRRKEEES